MARTSLPDGFFHVYSRRRGELVVFPADLDKERMLGIVKQAERRFGIRVLACVVMSTHFHLVVEASQAELSRALHWIKSVYARDFNKRNQRFGSLVAERFSCLVIDSEERLAAACA